MIDCEGKFRDGLKEQACFVTIVSRFIYFLYTVVVVGVFFPIPEANIDAAYFVENCLNHFTGSLPHSAGSFPPKAMLRHSSLCSSCSFLSSGFSYFCLSFLFSLHHHCEAKENERGMKE
jgi:hypothetical protein